MHMSSIPEIDSVRLRLCISGGPYKSTREIGLKKSIVVDDFLLWQSRSRLVLWLSQ